MIEEEIFSLIEKMEAKEDVKKDVAVEKEERKSSIRGKREEKWRA